MNSAENWLIKKGVLILASILAILQFLSLGLIAGPIYRGEISPWVWEQFGRQAAKHGTGDAFLSVVLAIRIDLWNQPKESRTQRA